MLPRTINTGRLTLRPTHLNDTEAVYVNGLDDEWTQFLPLPRPYSFAMAESHVADILQRDHARHPTWTIVLDSEVVGSINLRIDISNCLAEFGIGISRKQWGRGVATESARGVLASASETLHELNRIQARAGALNVMSIRMMEKLGMKREAHLRQVSRVRGKFVDHVVYGILRPEWYAAASTLPEQ